MTASVLPRPLGAYARWRRAGDLVFVAGVSARLPGGEIDGVLRDGAEVRYDVAAQTRRVLLTINALVQEAGGAGLADCVDMQAFLVHAEDFATFNATYGEFFPGEAPTRTTVVVRALPHPDMVVEIKAVACVPVASSQ
ncbi:RidA family protein [Acidovorax sp. JHL-9]|uniref:RidA family protein n=1 Tax=Acidovorax sp. JHL-9 TaxID=1276756 RepID=UPI00040FDE0C|nr:RidA family protein [Acidovorax sp. JHL-9]